MTLKLHPQASRTRRQTAVEQTSDLLKAYLEHWPDLFANTEPEADRDDQISGLFTGFIVPQRRSA